MNRKSNAEKLNTLIHSAFRAMLEGTKDMVFVKDANLVYVAASMPFAQMTGRDCVEDLIERTDFDLFSDIELAERYVADDRKLLQEGKNLIDYVEPIPDENGQARYGSTSKYILRDENNEIIGILGITRDITREYIARQHYQQELTYLFELPADTFAVAYIDIDDWRLISQRRQSINEGSLQSCFTLEGFCEAAVESIVDEENEAMAFYRDFSQESLKGIHASGRCNLSFEYQRRLTNGKVRWVHNTVRFLIEVDSGHLCAMLSAKDIEAEKREERKLLEAAQMDRMTMLLNRDTTMEKINSILTGEPDNMHVLFMIDVDNFKLLNDTQGHPAGDSFLINFAEEIRAHFRDTDVVGRVGGDEFFALMRKVSGVHETAKKAEEVLEAIQNVCADYSDVHISGSIGISVYPENGQTLDELYAQADSALYQAKRKGKNQYVYAHK